MNLSATCPWELITICVPPPASVVLAARHLSGAIYFSAIPMRFSQLCICRCVAAAAQEGVMGNALASNYSETTVRDWAAFGGPTSDPRG